MRLALDLTVGLKFERAIQHCDNLVAVHAKASGTGKGRRRKETSIHRAIIVIAIASWQALVQDLTIYLLNDRMPQSADPNFGVAKLISGQITQAINNFSTPNAQNSRRLLQMVGYDPYPHWTWSNGVTGRRSVTYRPHQIEGQLKQWLDVRHAIAHGDERMPEVEVLEVVRNGSSSTNRNDGPSIRLSDARKCIAFIRKLSEVTLDGAAQELALGNGNPSISEIQADQPN